MKRLKSMIIILLAVLALGALGASSAQAITTPFFSIGGTRLAAGRTHNIDTRAKSSFIGTDASGSSKTTCTGVGSVGGVLLGANEGTAGISGGEVAVFSGCTLEGNGTSCHLAPTEGSAETTTVIQTEPIEAEQVFNVEGTHGGKKLLSLLLPASKSLGFGKVNFGGTCTLKSTIASGSVVAEDVLDSAGEGNVEFGQAPQERTSWDLRYPATPIKQVWLVANGVGKIVEAGAEAFNEESILTGTALGLLASTKFVPEPNALWSPLP
jgi:hypothetical protein